MIKIRPHHLLCVSGFNGKGYSDDFIQNMARVVRALKNKKEILITFGYDDICSKCPDLNNEKCVSEEKVGKHDSLVANELDLENGKVYNTVGLSKDTDAKKTALKRYCVSCEWFDECY